METKKFCCLCVVILELSAMYFVETLQISHTSSKIGVSSVIKCTSDNGNDMDWIVDDIPIAACLGATANSCLPPCTECSSVITSPATTFSYTLSSVGYTSCKKYGCKEGITALVSEFTLEVTDFSVDNSTAVLNPQEPTANTDGNVSITTPCIFPTSSDAITINWYKIFVNKSNQAELLDANDADIQPYSETDTNGCSTCGTKSAGKMTVGVKFKAPSSNGDEIKLQVEIKHADFTDHLYYTFDQSYYLAGPPTITTTTTTTTATPLTTATETTTTSTMLSTTTTTPASTTTKSTTKRTIMPSTATNVPTSTTSKSTTTTTSMPSTASYAPTSATTETITPDATNTTSNERTVVIVVSSTVGGVVLVGLVVFLVGLFLYRARRHGHGKGKHGHKRTTRQQRSDGAYIYSGPNNSHDMEMHPIAAFYMDSRHGYPHYTRRYPDKRLQVTNQKQEIRRYEGAQMRNTNNVKTKYSVYPENMVYSGNTRSIYPNHYRRHEEWQRSTTAGNIHPGHVNHAHQSGSTYYHPQDYSDNWYMY